MVQEHVERFIILMPRKSANEKGNTGDYERASGAKNDD